MKKILCVLAALIVSLPSAGQAEEGLTVLITGANRGLGLEYARQLSAKGYEVIGTARNPAEAVELKEVAARVEPLDVADPASVAALAQRLDGIAIDILINNAGIFDRRDVTLDKVDFQVVEQTFAVNTLGPLRVIQALMPNLRAGEGKRIVGISSMLGSIGYNTRGRWYAYRASKAALNQFNRVLSVELAPEGFVCVVLHPGWVRTDMGGPNATYSPEESVAGMVAVIEGLTAEDNGRFYDFRGLDAPW